MVHEAPDAMLPAQLFVWPNGPVTATPETCKGPVPVLCNVILFEALVEPATWDEKDRVTGLTEAAGAVPVPLRVKT
jgi:hypothetical protein